MAGLWTGSIINSNETASVFNQLFNRKAVSMVRKKEALFYSVLGKTEAGSNPHAPVEFQRLNKITGHNVEVKLRGKLFSNLATVSDGSSEVATATPELVADMYGAAEMPLTHYAHSIAFPNHELDRFKGDESKTLNWIDDQFESIMLTYEKELSTQINAANAPSRTQLGGWAYAVSDGVSSGESGNATYLTLDRSDAGNVDWRSVVSANVGTFTLPKLRSLRNQVLVNGGTPDTGIAGPTVYGIVENALEPYTIITDYQPLQEFGALYFRYAGINFMLERHAPSGNLGVLDSSSWAFYLNQAPLTAAGVVPAPWLTSSHVLTYEIWTGLLTSSPSWNAKMTGITG